MPELPEVETIVRQLAGRLIGQRVDATCVTWPRTVATHDPAAFAAALQGRTIAAVQRRAKFIVVAVPPQALIIHLRMTGHLYSCDAPDSACAADPHVRAYWEFASGQALYFSDLRKFGRLYLVDDAAQVLAGLGPEPLDDSFTADGLVGLLQARQRQIKPLLLDQHFIAGLGNIYVDESLWRARIHPLARADTLAPSQGRVLWGAIRDTLGEAISDGGTTLRDYRNAHNEQGGHGPTLAVYGRTGQPCSRCGRPIVRLVVGSRGTHICPQCQPSPNGAESSDDDHL